VITGGVVVEVKETIASADRALTIKRAFGEPYQQDGITLIPVARITGGAGGGGGDAPEGKGEGSGFGVSVSPVGVYRVEGHAVSWHPSIDVNRVINGAVVLAVIWLLTARSIARARARRPRGR
jgi:uncharacterized spore protein YtfJ